MCQCNWHFVWAFSQPRILNSVALKSIPSKWNCARGRFKIWFHHPSYKAIHRIHISDPFSGINPKIIAGNVSPSNIHRLIKSKKYFQTFLFSSFFHARLAFVFDLSAIVCVRRWSRVITSTVTQAVHIGHRARSPVAAQQSRNEINKQIQLSWMLCCKSGRCSSHDNFHDDMTWIKCPSALTNSVINFVLSIHLVNQLRSNQPGWPFSRGDSMTFGRVIPFENHARQPSNKRLNG